MKIALFYGGKSFEHEISIITALQAATFFPKEYELIPIYIKDGVLSVKKNYRVFSSYLGKDNGKKAYFKKGGVHISGRGYVKLDCAFVATHGGEGENGILASLLEYYEIAYTCCSPLACGICMDKKITKQMLIAEGFDTPKMIDNANISFPCIVKPRNLGSSIGVSVAYKNKDLEELNCNSDSFGPLMIEEYIEDATELNCAAFVSEGKIIVSEVEKPLCKGDFLNYDEKYKSGSKKELPAEISEELKEQIQKTTAQIYRKLELFGVVRVDYLQSKEGRLFVNEINAIPGSMAYYLFSINGICFSELIRKLVKEGINRGTAKPIVFSTEILKLYCGKMQGTKGGALKG